MDTTQLKHKLGSYYIDCIEKDFFLDSIGYHNFESVEPLKFSRKQRIYALHMIFAGSGTLNIYGKTYKLGQFDMFLIPQGEVISYYPDEDNPWRYFWFQFSGSLAESYANKMGFSNGNPIIHPTNANEICIEVYKLLERLNEGKNVEYYHALSTFYKVISILETPESESKNSLYEQILTYLTTHFHNPEFKIEDICRDFNISHSYLCKIFKDKGQSVRDILINERIKEAKRLLNETQLSVGEVGYSVGFYDNIHFMKTFKKRVGLTALKFRENRFK